MSFIIPSPRPYTDFADPHFVLPQDQFFFLDTSFLIAVINEADDFHGKALPLWKKLKGEILLINGIVANEYLYIMGRSLYTQERIMQIFYQVGANREAYWRTVNNTDFKAEWTRLVRTDLQTATVFIKQAASCLRPLLETKAIEVWPDSTGALIESLELQAKHCLGIADSQLIATAKSIEAIFITTDLELAKVGIPGLIVFATTPL